LDAIGDLYLTGHRIVGEFQGFCSSHADTANLLRLVFAEDSNWDLIEAPESNASDTGQTWDQPLRQATAG